MKKIKKDEDEEDEEEEEDEDSVLVRFGSYYENSPKSSGFFLILKINSNLPKKTEI